MPRGSEVDSLPRNSLDVHGAGMGAMTTAEQVLVRPSRARVRRRVSRRSLAGYAFVAPALILLVVFALGPFLFTIWVSLHSGNMLTPLRTMPLEGAGNYSYLLNDDALFRETFGNTVYFAVGNVVVSVVLALSIALVRSEEHTSELQ